MTDQPEGDGGEAASEAAQQYEPPEFLRLRAFITLNNLPVSEPFITDAFRDLEGLMELLDAGLAAAYGSPPEHWFPNNVAATALLTRAYQGIQAASLLCVLAFYVEARSTMRGVYESAGLARMLAHRPDFAERWLHEGEWFKDNLQRQFVTKMSGETDLPHAETYRHLSENAHPKAVSTLSCLFDREGSYRPMAYPLVDEDDARETARYITAVSLYVLWTFRNAAAHHDAIPTWWMKRLTELSEHISGVAHDHLDKDWDAQQKRHDALTAQVQHSKELAQALADDPDSVQNRLRRMRAEADWR